ncbi:hypothetical protein PAXRUDRAFT_831936 [Paxillus rubicundulus Ve08.2h10]|uniref:Uncharacterized protein n=1 Tax=Paxillus rubicundulus Ve08.2h10 TaxID=930991 RepID=A0A0D0DVU3_9AGAM|nr:hypothetical protein PAXRUDRAFT_831936 [Paxillus rubicundulus Ve08.2h10]
MQSLLFSYVPKTGRKVRLGGGQKSLLDNLNVSLYSMIDQFMCVVEPWAAFPGHG